MSHIHIFMCLEWVISHMSVVSRRSTVRLKQVAAQPQSKTWRSATSNHTMSHVAHVHESRVSQVMHVRGPTRKRGCETQNPKNGVLLRRDRQGESCRTCFWVRDKSWMSHVTYVRERLEKGAAGLGTQKMECCYVLFQNESCRTCSGVMDESVARCRGLTRKRRSAVSVGGRLRHVTYSRIYELWMSHIMHVRRTIWERDGVTRNPKNGVLLRRVPQGVMSHMFLSQGWVMDESWISHEWVMSWMSGVRLEKGATWLGPPKMECFCFKSWARHLAYGGGYVCVYIYIYIHIYIYI